ncbi:MAG: DUF333 domain-containing protein [Candidatus Woesearchaeota archaeon]
MKKMVLIFLALSVLLFAGCSSYDVYECVDDYTYWISLSRPAEENCVVNGNTLEYVQDDEGSDTVKCILKSGKKCDVNSYHNNLC